MIKCSRCNHDNRAGAKFCEECAAPLERACGSCGALVSSTAKFCPECARPVAKASAASEQFDTPARYTPEHLSENILTSKATLAYSTPLTPQPFLLVVRKNSRLTISPTTANPDRNKNTC